MPRFPPSPAPRSPTTSPALPRRRHGIVGNGWYVRDECEVRFWRQSNRLVQAPKIWETRARRRSVVHLREHVLVVQHVFVGGLQRDAAADVSGRRPQAARRLHAPRPACATTSSAELGHVSALQLLGTAGVDRLDALDRGRVEAGRTDSISPTLTLVYLPHLDYNLQRVGAIVGRGARGRAAGRRGLRRSDSVLRSARRAASSCSRNTGSGTCPRPVHLNRALRSTGSWPCATSSASSCSTPGASAAFAVADHQVAHVYVNDPCAARRGPRHCVESTPGVERVLDAAGKREYRIDHPRAGDLIAIAEARRLVHLLLLARRRAGAGLRANGRHPSQAGLRPGRAVPRSRDSHARR